MKKIVEPEVGDIFIITNRPKKCKNIKREFVIKSCSFGTITYDDNRTNNNCVCNICDPDNNYRTIFPYLGNTLYPDQYSNYRTKTFVESNKNKKVSTGCIKVVEKKLERQREIALKLLLRK
jgi:peptide methionine sulfoxide reductase MsrA